jgi:lipoyl-dependent peroxiredoxin
METKEKKSIQIEKVMYTAKTHTTGGRDGSSRTPDGRLDVKLSSPGTSGTGTNPEQLFAAGWAACFIASMKIAAGKMKVTIPAEASVDTEVDLLVKGETASLRARHNVSLPGLDPEIAQTIVDAAHQICPYSSATRGNIDVAFKVSTAV